MTDPTPTPDQAAPVEGELPPWITGLAAESSTAVKGWQDRRDVEIEVLRDLAAVLHASRGSATSGSLLTLPKRIILSVLLGSAVNVVEQLVTQLEEPALPFVTLRTMAGLLDKGA